MFRANTSVNFYKQAAEEIQWFPSLKLSKQESLNTAHNIFWTELARDDSKRHAVTKAFFALKERTDITGNITAIAC